MSDHQHLPFYCPFVEKSILAYFLDQNSSVEFEEFSCVAITTTHISACKIVTVRSVHSCLTHFSQHTYTHVHTHMPD